MVNLLVIRVGARDWCGDISLAHTTRNSSMKTRKHTTGGISTELFIQRCPTENMVVCKQAINTYTTKQTKVGSD